MCVGGYNNGVWGGGIIMVCVCGGIIMVCVGGGYNNGVWGGIIMVCVCVGYNNGVCVWGGV